MLDQPTEVEIREHREFLARITKVARANVRQFVELRAMVVIDDALDELERAARSEGEFAARYPLPEDDGDSLAASSPERPE